MVKRYYFISLFFLLLSSCASQPTTGSDITTATLQPLSTVTPLPSLSTQTTDATLIPKQKDMIFVEFFAVT